MSTKEILTTPELADLLGFKLQTIYNRINRGASMPAVINVPGLKGKRYLKSDIMAWLETFKKEMTCPHKKKGRPRKTQA